MLKARPVFCFAGEKGGLPWSKKNSLILREGAVQHLDALSLMKVVMAACSVENEVESWVRPGSAESNLLG